MTGALALAVVAAGCGNSNGASSSTSSSGGPLATALAYSRCMRSHGIHDFPDPTTPPGGGVTFQLNGGAGSDLNHTNPTFQAASQACRTLSPGGQQAPAAPTSQIAEEVTWAHCLRSHGVPGFPDPNSNGAIDSAKFDPSSPAFQRASAACKSLQPSGPVAAAPGPP
ncbi:MAG: hypothetical protein ACLP50_37315 [Solirubrobacteraceae bacterium]